MVEVVAVSGVARRVSSGRWLAWQLLGLGIACGRFEKKFLKVVGHGLIGRRRGVGGEREGKRGAAHDPIVLTIGVLCDYGLWICLSKTERMRSNSTSNWPPVGESSAHIFTKQAPVWAKGPQNAERRRVLR
eukprot:scaffold231789_cov33-Tisochrysis_lutea.AAC.3